MQPGLRNPPFEGYSYEVGSHRKDNRASSCTTFILGGLPEAVKDSLVLFPWTWSSIEVPQALKRNKQLWRRLTSAWETNVQMSQVILVSGLSGCETIPQECLATVDFFERSLDTCFTVFLT